MPPETVPVRRREQNVNQQMPGPSRAGRNLSDQQFVRDWASLQPGDCVEVSRIDSSFYVAYVDDRSDDGELIWVVENGTGHRRLFVRDDPVLFYSIQDSTHHSNGVFSISGKEAVNHA
jgi:hypothetical protein